MGLHVEKYNSILELAPWQGHNYNPHIYITWCHLENNKIVADDVVAYKQSISYEKCYACSNLHTLFDLYDLWSTNSGSNVTEILYDLQTKNCGLYFTEIVCDLLFVDRAI